MWIKLWAVTATLVLALPRAAVSELGCVSECYCTALRNDYHLRGKKSRCYEFCNTVLRIREDFPPRVLRPFGSFSSLQRKTLCIKIIKALQWKDDVQEEWGDRQVHHLCSGGNTAGKKTWALSWILISKSIIWSQRIAFGIRCKIIFCKCSGTTKIWSIIFTS